jgi:hypothetical protein
MSDARWREPDGQDLSAAAFRRQRIFESIPSGETCRALLLLCEFYCRDRPPAFVTLDGKSQAVKFIEPKPVHCPSLSVSQNDGFADKLGLSPVKFSKDRARAHFSG